MMPDSVTQLRQRLQEGTATPEEVIEALERDNSKHISDLESEVEVTTLSSGIEALDQYKIFKGNIPELVVVGARPGVGKTALMLQVAAHVAKEGDVLFFNLEMRDNVLYKRMVSLVGEYPADKLKNQAPRLEAVKRQMRDLKLRIISAHQPDISEIRIAARKWARGKNPKMIVIDYIQIVGCQEMRSRHEEVKEIVQQLRQMAAELNCTVFTASQLNRQPDARGKAKGVGYGDFSPLLTDLAESDAVGKDSDVVFFLSRQDNTTNLLGNETDLVVSKNRAGALGRCKLDFSEAMTKFFSKETPI